MSPARPPVPRRVAPTQPARQGRAAPATPAAERARAAAPTAPTGERRRPQVPAAPAAGRGGAVPLATSATGQAPPSVPPRARPAERRLPAQRAAAPVVRPSVVSWQSAERFAERVRARRTVAARKVAAVAGVALLLLLMGWVALASPLLALRSDQLHVVGASELVSTDQLDAATAPYVGVPLARLDTVGLRERLLTVPGVLDVRVMRDWPHGLRITVTPRAPVAAVPADGGFALLDPEGVHLATQAQAPEGLPVVDVPAGDARTLQAVLSVLHALPAPLAAQVSAVKATTQDTVALTLSDGVVVEWGSAESSALKAAVLGTLRADQSLGEVKVIDVSAPGMPVVH